MLVLTVHWWLATVSVGGLLIIYLYLSGMWYGTAPRMDAKKDLCLNEIGLYMLWYEFVDITGEFLNYDEV